MSEEKRIQETINESRRAFFKQAGMGLMFSTVMSLVPGNPISGMLGWKAYAQSEKKISDELLQIAAKYGKPTGKYGKIGDPVTLTVGYQPYCTPYWTSSINKQAQIWKKYLPQGSNVVWFRSLSGPLINNNMYAGKNQLGYMAETPAMRSGDTVQCDMISVTGYDVGESGAICIDQKLLDEGKIKGPKDLEGQKVGTPVGSYSHRQILAWCEQNGVKTNILDQSTELQITNLRAQNITAAVTWEPYPSWLEQRGIAKRWVTGQDMACTCKKYYPDAVDHTYRVVGALLAIHEWLRDRPDIMVAFLKAEEESRDLLMNDRDLAAFYIWSDVSEVHPAVVRVVLDMMVWDGRITPECRKHLKAVARMWREIDIIRSERTKDPDKFVDEWADDRYLRYAINELKAQGQWTSDQLPGFPKEARPDQVKLHTWKTYENVDLKEKPWNPTKA
ncbi:MAG: ABC transporter substrate-binding protein [Syntrophobacteraceae bacterium]|nr:ABC transporter substrate-binding protein [Syntrophobacteraceae bacterium]